MVINAAEIAHGVWELHSLATVAGGVAGILVASVELACTLPVHTLPPEDVLPGLGQPMVDKLAAIGVDSMVFFCGAGLDPTATDCEIQATRLYTSLDQARDEAVAMKRLQWVVVSWRTDQSNSFRVEDSGG
jgi:hypothetical protein